MPIFPHTVVPQTIYNFCIPKLFISVKNANSPLLNQDSKNPLSNNTLNTSDDALDTVDIKIGDLVYKDNGINGNNNTYFSLNVLKELGVQIGKIEQEENLIKLDISSQFPLKFANLKIKDKVYENKVLILPITSNSYIPIKLLKSLNIKESMIINNQNIIYEDMNYVKTSELKNLGVKISWEATTRTLSLDKQNIY